MSWNYILMCTQALVNLLDLLVECEHLYSITIVQYGDQGNSVAVDGAKNYSPCMIMSNCEVWTAKGWGNKNNIWLF